MSIAVFTSPPVQVNVDGGVLTNHGQDVVYYRDETPVTATTHDGMLATGEGVVLDGSQWLVSAGRSSVSVAAFTDTSDPGRAFAFFNA